MAMLAIQAIFRRVMSVERSHTFSVELTSKYSAIPGEPKQPFFPVDVHEPATASERVLEEGSRNGIWERTISGKMAQSAQPRTIFLASDHPATLEAFAR